MFCGHSCLAGLFHLRRRPPPFLPFFLSSPMGLILRLRSGNSPGTFLLLLPSTVRIQAIHCSFIYPFLLLLSPVYIRSFPMRQSNNTEGRKGWDREEKWMAVPAPRNCPSMQPERCLSPSFTFFTQDVGNSTLNVHTVNLYPMPLFLGKGACFETLEQAMRKSF